MTAKQDQTGASKQDGVLMKDGCWELRSHKPTKGVTELSRLVSYIAHKCPQTKETYYWYSLALIDTLCFVCHKHPPDDLMGLWKLHNMDYIQNGVTQW